ncbi:MAG TPA: LysR family transcriptional regulator [Casimicrobiaceae bacterium]|nr:LysR family transcriptional regulator [Casimicrobiaceae bacterium]
MRHTDPRNRERQRAIDRYEIVVNKLRPRDMELVLAIHAHKSITAAALELGLTQPAASRALRDIEQLLRVHLFDRDRARGMTLTAAGELVLVRARSLLADFRSLTAELDAYRAGTGGRLRLGIIPFVSGPLIERLIAELTGQRQRMCVTVTEGATTALLEQLRLQNLDAVIGRCSTEPLPPGLMQETLVRQDGCLLAHAKNPLVRSQRIKLADLGAFQWLLPPAGTPTRTAINAVFARAMLSPPVATVEASSTKIIHLALRVNPRMLSIVPSDAGDDIQRLGGVRRLPFPVPLEIPPVGLISAVRHRDTPLLRNLRNTLREMVRARHDD